MTDPVEKMENNATVDMLNEACNDSITFTLSARDDAHEFL